MSHSAKKWMTAAALVWTATMATTAHAQLLRSTGAELVGGLDQRWQISTNNGSTWTQAAKVANNPGWGGDFGLWVSSSASATGGGGNYRIRQQFTLNAGDALSFGLACGIDNTFGSFLVNGAAFNLGFNCPFGNTGSDKAFTTADFTTGLNTIELRWTGDNVTDGAAVRISNLVYTPGTPNTTVPEPSTYLLMASGLVAISVVRKRMAARAT